MIFCLLCILNEKMNNLNSSSNFRFKMLWLQYCKKDTLRPVSRFPPKVIKYKKVKVIKVKGH